MKSVRRYASRLNFDSLEDGCVTVRERDTMEQVRMPIAQLSAYIQEKIAY